MTKLSDLFDRGSQSPWLDNLTRTRPAGRRRVPSHRPRRAGGDRQPHDRGQGHRVLRRLRPAVRGPDRADTPSRTPTGTSPSPTSSTPWRCCGRPSTPARAPTGSSRSRWRPSWAHDTRGHHEGRPGPARTHRRTQPAGQDPRHHRGRTRHRGHGRGRPQHQRDSDLLPGPLPPGPRGLPGRAWRPWPTAAGISPTVHGVASFFVSRVDTEVDRRLEEIGTDEALALRGRAAVAQAKLAYQLFRDAHTGARWERLADRGARVQRPLWASTSTKNPALSRHALRRQPDRTRHGQHAGGEHPARRSRTTAPSPARSTSTSPAAETIMHALARAGVDMDDVGHTLEREGIAAFQASFTHVLGTLEAQDAPGPLRPGRAAEERVDWAGWAVFGLLATAVLTALMIAAQLGGLSRLDLPLILGPSSPRTPTGPARPASSSTWSSARASPSATPPASRSWAGRPGGSAGCSGSFTAPSP